MDTLRLIKEVRRRPFLWKPEIVRLPRSIKLALWEKVSERVGADVIACRSEWTKLRNEYQKKKCCTQILIKVAKNRGSYDPNKNYGGEWIYAKPLKFLDTVNKPKTKDNVCNNYDSDQGSIAGSSDSEIEIEIEDSDHCDLENESGPNITVEKKTNQTNFLGVTDSSSQHQSDNMSASHDYKFSTEIAPFHNIVNVYVKEEPEIEINDDMYFGNSRKSVDFIGQEFAKENSIKIPCALSNDETSERCNLLDVLKSEDDMPSTFTAIDAKEKAKIACPNDNESSKQYYQFKNMGNIVIKQEPDNETDVDAPTNKKSSKPINILVDPEKEENIVRRSGTSNINKRKGSVCSYVNESFTQNLHHNNVENVYIKKEPVEHPEHEKIWENTYNNESSKSHDNTFHTGTSSVLLSPKRLRLDKTTLAPKQINSAVDKQRSILPKFFHNSEDRNSLTDLQDKTISAKTFVDISDLDCNFLISFLSHMKSMSQFQNSTFRAKMVEIMLSILSTGEKEDRDGINALESHKQNITLKELVAIGDSDCNFLVSFLPDLKSLSGLQNLQFRAKMSDLILEIFSSPSHNTDSGSMS